MALERKDHIGDTTTTTGTGTVSLAAVAQTGARIFAGNVTSGATVRYEIRSIDNTEWEVGEGVFTDATPDTLTRVTVYASSNSGSLVNFSAGTKNVSLIFSANDLTTIIEERTNQATSKTTPVDADEIPIVDSAASNVLKKLTWSNLKATLKTYFDTLYSTAVKATGAEINTGTDDAKFATAKAITDSNVAFLSDIQGNARSYRAKAYRNTAQTINGATKVQLNTEVYDPNNNFDNATNYRYTCPVAGYYFVIGRSDFTVTRSFTSIYKNGSEVIRGNDIQLGSSAQNANQVQGIIYCAANDYLELYAYASASTSTQINTEATVFMAVEYISA